MNPKIKKTEKIYSGHIFSLQRETALLDGQIYEREIIRHPGSAVIIPVFEDGRIALVEQFRLAANQYLLELPAGTIDKGETPLETAKRELNEEIGVIAQNFEKLAEFYVSPGFLDEKMTLFLATGISDGKQNLDEDEILSVKMIPWEKCLNMIKSHDIIDAKTITGLLLARDKFTPN